MFYIMSLNHPTFFVLIEHDDRFADFIYIKKKTSKRIERGPAKFTCNINNSVIRWLCQEVHFLNTVIILHKKKE